MVTLYGIPNCDTVSKARKWLSANEIDFQFHNFKKDGLEQETLEQWIKAVGWEVLLNKRSMTWRNLPDASKVDIDQSKATELLLNNTSMIKRPVLNNNGEFQVGFKVEQYEAIF